MRVNQEGRIENGETEGRQKGKMVKEPVVNMGKNAGRAKNLEQQTVESQIQLSEGQS